MTLVYFCFNGNVKKLIKDEEFRWFFFFVLGAIIVVMVWILYLGFASDVENAFRKAAFQVVTLFLRVDSLRMTIFLGDRFSGLSH